MSSSISPFAPTSLPNMPTIDGVRMAAMAAGIKYQGRTDLVAFLFDEATTVAGVFTQSRCPSAPVETCRQHLPQGRARVLVVNSGNANAFTGKKGREATQMTVDAACHVAKVAPETVFLSSTGVIGEPIDTSAFGEHLDHLVTHATGDGWVEAAKAIMTTDTFAKLATRSIIVDGKTVTINGIAKGAGMIAPDMATMLAYIATDADVTASALQQLLDTHVASTFNAISVDSDTSTSDTLLAFATGKAGNEPIADDRHKDFVAFSEAFHAVLHELAIMIVSDGEGISKRIRVDISGAATDASAKRIARAIVDSPLVKTAIAGQDANWGRVVMAIGKAGEPADRDRIEIAFGDIVVARDGERVPDYSEEVCAHYMRSHEIAIAVNLHLGPGQATMWGCDLTADYVAINADYRS